MSADSDDEPPPDLPRYHESGGSSSSRRRPRGTRSVIYDVDDDIDGLVTIYAALICGMILIGAICIVFKATMTPRNTIAITGVSGLTDPVADTNQGGWLLNPTFNLTVRIASGSGMLHLHGACIDPKTIVKVSYSHQRLPLATGDVPVVCVGPQRSSVDRPVVASGRNVWMPGFLMGILAEEVRSGEAMFHVELLAYRWYSQHEGSWTSESRGGGSSGKIIYFSSVSA